MIGEAERLDRANSLLTEISVLGRQFFRHGDRVSRLELDGRGRVWIIDKWSGKRIYTHYRGAWRGFTEGGTLQSLVRALARFVSRGEPVPSGHFGPWSQWACGGDPWGYGDDMALVREAAERLEIVSAPPAPGEEERDGE